MQMVDFGRFQTCYEPLKVLLNSCSSLAEEGQALLIQGREGSGRRLMAETLHDRRLVASRPIKRITQNLLSSDWGLEFGDTVLLENISTWNRWELNTLYDRLLKAHGFYGEAGIFWLATAGVQPLDHEGLKNFFRKSIQIPSLKERQCDIRGLAQIFCETVCWMQGLVKKILSPSALQKLERRTYSGEVSELERLLEKVVLACAGTVVEGFDIPTITQDIVESQLPSRIMTLEEMERRLIIQTLELTQHNKSQAARLLGISIRTLRNKLSVYKEAGFYESDLR